MRPRAKPRPKTQPVEAERAAALWRAIAQPSYSLDPEQWDEPISPRMLDKLAAGRLRRVLDGLASGRSPGPYMVVDGWREILEDAGVLGNDPEGAA